MSQPCRVVTGIALCLLACSAAADTLRVETPRLPAGSSWTVVVVTEILA